MSKDDETPTDNRSTIEIFADDMKATKVAAQNTETSQLRMYEEFKAFRGVVETYRRRTWTPTVVSIAAALVSLACAVAAATR